MLERMARNPSPLYLRELAQGVKGDYSTSEVLDAVCELEENGLVSPATWRLTDEGKAQAEAIGREGRAAA